MQFPERLDLLELNAVFDLEVLQPGTVTLPLGRDKINLLNDRAMLNGQPVSIDWDADGRGISFEVDDGGRRPFGDCRATRRATF